MGGFAAAVVGEKHETVLIEVFEQHRTLARHAGGVHRGQAHRVGLGHAKFVRLGEPGGELGDGLGGKIRPVQPTGGIFPAEIG